MIRVKNRCHVERKNGRILCVKRYWEIIADNLSRGGWSYGYVSAVDREGRTIWIADAHRGDGKRFVVRANGKLTAFLELESAVRAGASVTCTGNRGAGADGISGEALYRN